jgi:hypothetical protein
MKKLLLAFALLFSLRSFAQTNEKNIILDLSDRIFRYEVNLNIDSLSSLFDKSISVVNSQGTALNKDEYLKTLRSVNFKHDSIKVEQASVSIKGNTAILTGKGRFFMTVSGNKLNRHLSYMEVCIKDDKSWKLLALYASAIPD